MKPLNRPLKTSKTLAGDWPTKIKSSVTKLKVLWHYNNDVIFVSDEKQRTTFESRSVYKPIACLQRFKLHTNDLNYWLNFKMECTVYTWELQIRTVESAVRIVLLSLKVCSPCSQVLLVAERTWRYAAGFFFNISRWKN